MLCNASSPSLPPSFIAFLSLSFSAFGNSLGQNWRREPNSSKEDGTVVRIRLRCVVSRKGRADADGGGGEREPVKRNNARKIILLPVKRVIYLRIFGEF